MTIQKTLTAICGTVIIMSSLAYGGTAYYPDRGQSAADSPEIESMTISSKDLYFNESTLQLNLKDHTVPSCVLMKSFAVENGMSLVEIAHSLKNKKSSVRCTKNKQGDYVANKIFLAL